MGYKSKRKKVYNRNKTKRRKNKYSNKKKVNKRVTRKYKGGMDQPQVKRPKPITEAERVRLEAEERVRLEAELMPHLPHVLSIQDKQTTRSIINNFRKIGYEIKLNERNEWIIYVYPTKLFKNTKLPYQIRSLPSNDRLLINNALISRNLDALIDRDDLIKILEEIASNVSGCDLERDEVVEQAIRDGTIPANDIAQYRGKVGTIVSPDGRSIDITDGMKSLANVREVVPMELPVVGAGVSLAKGLYKYVIKQDDRVMFTPSNLLNCSLIKIKMYQIQGRNDMFFVNIDKILPKVRLLASFGQRDIYNEWFLFLKGLGALNITWQTITEANIPGNNFQSSSKEILDWIKGQQLNLSDYIGYVNWGNTCLTISEISHPCLNEGIQDVKAAGEFCVICDEEGNCYIVKVTTYTGHYKTDVLMLPTVQRFFHGKGYVKLDLFSDCLAISEATKMQRCSDYDPSIQQQEGLLVPFTGPLP